MKGDACYLWTFVHCLAFCNMVVLAALGLPARQPAWPRCDRLEAKKSAWKCLTKAKLKVQGLMKYDSSRSIAPWHRIPLTVQHHCRRRL